MTLGLWDAHVGGGSRVGLVTLACLMPLLLR